MSFQCKFEPVPILQKSGAPNYIRSSGFDAEKLFAEFDIIGQTVSKTDQKESLSQMLNDNGGWVAFVCGLPEYVRLFSYTVMKRYSAETRRLDWHHVTGSRYDKYLDERREKENNAQLVILDSLLTHPPMYPEGSRGYDPARIGKIFDIVAQQRGLTSVIVLCPDMTPEEAYRISLIQADMMIYLKPRAKDIEI